MEKSNKKVLKSTRPRRRYDDQFKEEAVRLLELGKSGTQVAESLGVSVQMLYNWRTKKRQKEELLSAETGVNYYAELEAVRKKLRDVEMERDILKKALNIFSRNQ